MSPECVKWGMPKAGAQRLFLSRFTSNHTCSEKELQAMSERMEPACKSDVHLRSTDYKAAKAFKADRPFPGDYEWCQI